MLLMKNKPKRNRFLRATPTKSQLLVHQATVLGCSASVSLNMNSIYSKIEYKSRSDIDDRLSKIRTYNICDPEYYRETLRLIVSRYFELHLGYVPNLDIFLDGENIFLDGEKFMDTVSKEYFEFSGSNIFSFSTKNQTTEQLDPLYTMIVNSVVMGILCPKQRLPEKYHNLILAECIKGNRQPSILKYLNEVAS